jgi:DNA invertase Pin-like site-specific DNA recombinase
MLIVHALDRIGRSLPHLVTILEYLRQHNITLVSYRENIDLSSSTGKMLAGIFALMAEYERNIIRERTLAGLRNARARGIRLGRPCRPFDRAKARKLLEAGWSVRKTAEAVGEINVSTMHAYRRMLEKDGLPPCPKKGMQNERAKAANSG